MLQPAALTRIFLSTPSVRRATHRNPDVEHGQGISIHALREEGDKLAARGRFRTEAFLSTPSVRRATDGLHRAVNNMAFLSTPSVRRATRGHPDPSGTTRNFYPRPP